MKIIGKSHSLTRRCMVIFALLMLMQYPSLHAGNTKIHAFALGT